jgi:putative N-acetylmannosamine-6-phosphate epimerase
LSGKLDLETLRGGLVVSCQPVEGGPFDSDDIVVRYARVAEAAGAVAVRVEGASRVAAVRASVAIPIVGIVKRDLGDSPVRITPFEADVYMLAEAGANIIAVDATHRARPVSVETLLHTIHTSKAAAMADCSNAVDANRAYELGFDIVGSTLSGYTETEDAIPNAPDIALVRELAWRGYRVMAEGRYNTPDDAAKAIAAGAWAVTVGSAITRPEVVIGWFREAVSTAADAQTRERVVRQVKLV